MKRLSVLGLIVACFPLVSRGPVVAPSASLAQGDGEFETTANEDAAEPDSGDQGGGTIANPHGSGANDDAEEDEPGAGMEERNQDERDDDGAGTDEAASRTPAFVAGSHEQGLQAL